MKEPIQIKDIPFHLYIGCNCQVDGVSGFQLTGISSDNIPIIYGDHPGTTHKIHAYSSWGRVKLELKPLGNFSPDERAELDKIELILMRCIPLLKWGINLGIIPKEHFVIV